MNWELAIPYREGWFSVYGSVFLLVWLIPLVVKRSGAILWWGKECGAAILIAAVVFLIVPAQLGYPQSSPAESAAPVRWLKAIAGAHNLFPSLHVALSSVTILHLRKYAPEWLTLCLYAWWLLVVASTMLTHQHHAIDVIGGLALAWGVRAASLRIQPGSVHV